MPPAPGSMSASSRTATADGRKKTTIATSHRDKLASPNWLAAVVSQRSPTIAVMLNSTTSESRRTRGSRLGGSGMHRGGEPPDAAAQHRAARSEEHTSELQSRQYLVCRLLLEKKKTTTKHRSMT